MITRDSRKRATVLATLGRIRRQRTNLARIEFVAVQARSAAARKSVDALGKAMSEANTTARQAITAGGQAETMSAYRRRVAAIRSQAAVCNLELAASERLLVRRRSELAEATQQSRALQKAQQRASARQAAAVSRRRQKELEEVHASNVACVAPDCRLTGGGAL